MDLSKLPKLSNTTGSQPPPATADAPEPSPQAQPAASQPQELPVPAIGLAEAWISIGLGILILFIFPNTLHYIFSSTQFQQENTFTDKQGNAISYGQSIFFWTDLGITVFAAALIVEGIILAFARKMGPLYIAFVLTSLAAFFNIYVIFKSRSEIDFPLFCGVAVVILGYMALTQLRLIQFLRN
jgi:hypothetical protein